MQKINELVDLALQKLNFPIVEYSVTHPKIESHGDYSVNVAMILAKQLGQNPRELAQRIVGEICKDPIFVKNFEKIEVAGAGFINFWLKHEFLLAELKKAREEGYGTTEIFKGQKTYVEFTDPNPFKEFHIGHLMSNTIGEALCRILEANGAIVKRANYQGDVGLHVAKAVWGLKQKLSAEGKTMTVLQGQTLKERIGYLGQAYAHGATEYENNEASKAEINLINKAIYDGLATKEQSELMTLYHAGRDWSLVYFEEIYKRLGTKFEEYFFESEAGAEGLKVIEKALQGGILTVGDQGAVIFEGEKHGLHTRVFRNKLGLPTYEGKELALSMIKNERWHYDKSYIVTANEINEYFKVLLTVLKLVYPELGAKTVHLSHGIMKLTTGKMSSRTGKVVTGEGLLDELKDVVLKKMGEREVKNKEQVADAVAVAALKYSVLKQALGGDIVYDPEKMTNMEGNTGPFVQYTFARASSILRKYAQENQGEILQRTVLCKEEVGLLKWVYRYPEVVAEAGVTQAPHLVATYVFELASRFNSFYQSCRVFVEDPTSQEGSAGARNGAVNQFRYALTESVAKVIKSGLNLLGIKAPEEM